MPKPTGSSITTFRAQLTQDGLLDDATFATMEDEVEQIVNDAVRFADESPDPPLEALYDHVYKEDE